MEVQDSLKPEEKKLLNVLSEHRRFFGFKLTDDLLHLAEYAARDIMKEDVDLLDLINKKRPRIFLGSPSQLKRLRGKRNPYDEAAGKDRDLQNEINRRATEALPHVGKGVYAEVITAHMRFLGIPYQAVVNGGKE